MYDSSFLLHIITLIVSATAIKLKAAAVWAYICAIMIERLNVGSFGGIVTLIPAAMLLALVSFLVLVVPQIVVWAFNRLRA